MVCVSRQHLCLLRNQCNLLKTATGYKVDGRIPSTPDGSAHAGQAASDVRELLVHLPQNGQRQGSTLTLSKPRIGKGTGGLLFWWTHGGNVKWHNYLENKFLKKIPRSDITKYGGVKIPKSHHFIKAMISQAAQNSQSQPFRTLASHLQVYNHQECFTKKAAAKFR